MEVPRTIKQEKVKYEATALDGNLETNILDSMEIKLEPVKLEPHSYVLETSKLNQKFNLTEEAKMIKNNNKSMFNCSLNKLSEQKSSEIKLDGCKIEDAVDVKWDIENKELTNKDKINIEGKEQGQVTTLVSSPKRRKTRAASGSKKKINGDNFRCKQCEYKTAQNSYLKSHLKRHHSLKHKHSDVIMCSCDQCKFPRKFQTAHKLDLKKHGLKYKNPDEIDRYKCYQCDYQTIYKNSLKRHTLKHKKKLIKLLRINVFNVISKQFKDGI